MCIRPLGEHLYYEAAVGAENWEFLQGVPTRSRRLSRRYRNLPWLSFGEDSGFKARRKCQIQSCCDSQLMSGMAWLMHEPTLQVRLTTFVHPRPAYPWVFDRVQILLLRLPTRASRLHKAWSRE